MYSSEACAVHSQQSSGNRCSNPGWSSGMVSGAMEKSSLVAIGSRCGGTVCKHPVNSKSPLQNGQLLWPVGSSSS